MDENTLQDIYALKQAATTGSAEAMFLYGKAFERGDGVVEDQDEAMKWYEKAALLGETKSMQTLGYIYENDPHKKDIDTSLDWYEKAIAAGDMDSCLHVGILYLQGQVVEQNLEKP